MNCRLLSVLLCVLFIAPSFQYGILRVEEIWSTEDVLEVKIEEMVITESNIQIDYIEELNDSGVTVEDTIFDDGSITIPGDFTTCCGIEFKSSLEAYLGLFADAPNSPEPFSFTIDDNSGDVFILDELRAQGGIVVSDRFFVNGTNGDTRIEEGVLRPNGGVRVSVDRFSIDPATGAIVVTQDAQIADDVYFGELSATSDRTITRFPSVGDNGGATYFIGQDSASQGGDLILQPGDGGSSIGNIFLGTDRNSDLYFGRNSLSNGDDGGITTFSGQDSSNGNGGDIIFNGGFSGARGFGGEIILSPGLSSLDGKAGRIILGSPQASEAGNEVTIGRPTISSGTGGSTTIRGQLTANGMGGGLYLQAGSVRDGAGEPGDLYLSPGVAADGSFTVVFGKNTDTRMNLTRVQTVTSGGSTTLTGQDGNAGTGGDLYGRAGSGFGSTSAGGDLYLMPGSSNSADAGDIVLGVAHNELIVSRPTVDGTAGDTTIRGQNGLDGTGGDLILAGGNGLTQGGDVRIAAGAGGSAAGGSVTIAGGDGADLGGELIINAGSGIDRNGGDIAIATIGSGGEMTLSARGGAADGSIIVGPAVASFFINEMPVTIEASNLEIRGGEDVVTLSADPEGIIRWNNVAVLKDTQATDPVRVTTFPLPNLTTAVVQMSRDFDDILQALNQCGHGLVTSVTQPDNIPQTC